MRIGKGKVVELILRDGLRAARISCLANLIPSPGQYLLASDDPSAPVPVPLFHTDSAPQGFLAASVSESWIPGQEIYLRGPLGRGFTLPSSARRVALVAFDDSPARLRGLVQLSLRQDAAVTVVCDSSADHLPDDVEVQPLSALSEVIAWADYVAFDASRESLPGLRERLDFANQPSSGRDAQILIRAPMPCGGVADCGVCAVIAKFGWKMACKEGPVFDWEELT